MILDHRNVMFNFQGQSRECLKCGQRGCMIKNCTSVSHLSQGQGLPVCRLLGDIINEIYSRKYYNQIKLSTSLHSILAEPDDKQRPCNSIPQRDTRKNMEYSEEDRENMRIKRADSDI